MSKAPAWPRPSTSPGPRSAARWATGVRRCPASSIPRLTGPDRAARPPVTGWEETREDVPMDHDHSHAPGRDADRRLLLAALGLIVAFMAGEVVVGLVVGSLARLADAGHMLTDAGAIALALVAMRLAARPAAGAYTYGLKRAEILSAQVNGLTLAVLVVVFGVEGVRRLIDPPDVPGGPLAVVAVIGILVNLAAVSLVARADRRSLNVAGAFWHLVTDLFAFVATLLAGLVIALTGWTRADAVAALVVAALMAVAAYRLLRDSYRIFLEAAPRGIDPGAVEAAIRGVNGV